MAESSIFADFNILDSKTAEAFAEALDKSSKDPKRVRTSPRSVRLTDKDKIYEFFQDMKKDNNGR